MGISKTNHFSEEENKVATMLKAFGHPARVAIMEYLIKVVTCICGDNGKELQLARPTVSQQLKELKDAGLIIGSVEGNSICYCIDEKAIEELQKYFGNISNQLKEKKTNCC